MATRWALCGAGHVASDFCMCVNSLPKTEHELVAVAASTKEKAEKFAQAHGIQQSFGSYEELADLDEVDVIYISLWHKDHVRTSLMYLKAGKNVLCEKPAALTLEGCRQVLQTAKECGVFYAEGYLGRYFPAYRFLRDQLNSGAIGDVICVQATIALPCPVGPCDAGAMMALGCFTVNSANFVFGGKPEEILARGRMIRGHDVSGTVTLRYSHDRLASLTYITECGMGKCPMTIRGTKGSLEIPDFMWAPTQVILPDGKVKDFPLPAVKVEYPQTQGLVYQIQGVRENLLKGLKESPEIPHSDTESIMETVVECLRQIGIQPYTDTA